MHGVYVKYAVLIVLAFDTDGGPKLQRAAAVQKEEERGLQPGGRGGREARENPQMYCGESAVSSTSTVIERPVGPAVSIGCLQVTLAVLYMHMH